MLNTTSLDAVGNAKFSQHFVKPCYDSYCFSHIPSTIEFLFTGQGQSALPQTVLGNLPQRYNKIILFFIDAFGWRFFERYAEKYEFLRTVLSQGVTSKLTAQFPSTTAAHVTCIHTGLNVGQSGVYEWNYYEPLVDDMISPLPFSYAGDKYLHNSLKNSAIPSTEFFPRQTFYQTLQTQGIASHVLQHQAYTPSTYSDIVFQGATVHAYKNFQDALSQLTSLLTATSATSTYYFLYFDRIDAACHQYGPYARQFEEAVDDCFQAINQQFYQPLRGKTSDTLCILTADHGQIEVDPRQTFYLNEQIPGIERYLKTNSKGHLLVPAGSARDMFLHVKDEYIATIISYLQHYLTGKAEVYEVKDLLAQHFFGLQEPSQTFLGRVGNVVILPYKNQTVWWHEERKFDMHFQGHHGGLTPEEMEIPFLLLPL